MIRIINISRRHHSFITHHITKFTISTIINKNKNQRTMLLTTSLSILCIQASTLLSNNNNAVLAFTPSSSLTTPTAAIRPSISTSTASSTSLSSTPDDVGPSDYDPQSLLPTQKEVTVDLNEDDAIIRDELKRELLLLGSITNRGQYASPDEKNIIIDIVTQLEALNPTPEPASQCTGEWDLCLTSTQAFRSSPFFQSVRAIFGDEENSMVAENAFNLHDKATSVGKVGRVRQSISVSDDGVSEGSFISEVDIEVGIMGGLPFAVKGTVVTSANYAVIGPEGWDLTVKSTQVKRSNVPFLDQLLDDYPLEVPVGSVYETIRGSVPVAKLKTFYVDEAMRITRDQDDNFYVFCRA